MPLPPKTDDYVNNNSIGNPSGRWLFVNVRQALS